MLVALPAPVPVPDTAFWTACRAAPRGSRDGHEVEHLAPLSGTGTGTELRAPSKEQATWTIVRVSGMLVWFARGAERSSAGALYRDSWPELATF